MYTELEVINYLLSQVGAAPVDDLDTPLPDILNAQKRLKEALTYINKRSWWYNTLYWTLEPDEDGFISNFQGLQTIIKVLHAWPRTITVLWWTEEKGHVLYDALNGTPIFEEPLTAYYIVDLPFESLPLSAQDAVMYRAGKSMILHELEDTNKAALLDDDINDAMLQLKKEHLEVKQRHIVDTPAFLKFRNRVRPYKQIGNQRNPVYPGGGS